MFRILDLIEHRYLLVSTTLNLISKLFERTRAVATIGAGGGGRNPQSVPPPQWSWLQYSLIAIN